MNTPVRRIPAVAPAPPVQPPPALRPPRAAPKPQAPAAPPVAEWQKAERREETQLQEIAGVAVVLEHPGGGGEQSRDRDGTAGPPDDAAPSASAGGTGAGSGRQPDLPASLARLGGLVVAFAVHASAHGGWAAHVPLSGDLLPATTLHLHCEHGVLTLRFETSDWDSRDLVTRHAPGLVERLRGALPMLSAVQLAI